MSFPEPRKGGSMMLAFKGTNKTVLVIGSNTLAASRALYALEADSDVVVLAKGGKEDFCEELKWRAERGQVRLLSFEDVPISKVERADAESWQDDEAAAVAEILEEYPVISLVCVTDTLSSTPAPHRRSLPSAQSIHRLCRTHRVLVNITDLPALCDFTFPATHRFGFGSADGGSEGGATPLQIAVTTNGKGCRLAGRIRREIVAALPKEVGLAVENVGRFREMAKVHSEQVNGSEADAVQDAELNDEITITTPNNPVPQRPKFKLKSSSEEEESALEASRRRMKWVAQISEYWPIQKLAKMTEEDMMSLLSDDSFLQQPPVPGLNTDPIPSQHSLSVSSPTSNSKPPGRIYLIGSGPGHPSLLTLAAHSLLTTHAHVVLTDKLVPQAVLALIPSHVQVHVARKFPGNAERAQDEMMEMAVKGAREGKTVVRLKQGDPMLFGRAGEEILYFRQHGFECVVVPGLSSAFAAPLFANIPVTQRGVAESVVVCTGVGRQGKEVKVPGYERERMVVVLMGVARLGGLVDVLLSSEDDEPNLDSQENETKMKTRRRQGTRYPPHTPIAIIERASMPDQRVISSTLENIVQAMERTGEQRPPGLMVIGWSVLCLWGEGDVGVLDSGRGEGCMTKQEEKDKERVKKWLGGAMWRVSEGVDESWERLQASL